MFARYSSQTIGKMNEKNVLKKEKNHRSLLLQSLVQLSFKSRGNVNCKKTKKKSNISPEAIGAVLLKLHGRNQAGLPQT